MRSIGCSGEKGGMARNELFQFKSFSVLMFFSSKITELGSKDLSVSVDLGAGYWAIVTI